MTRTVIGCVWGAWRELQDRLGDQAPTYEWCETVWAAGLRRSAPAPAAVPAWLTQELFARWRAAQADERRVRGGFRYHQLSLPIWGAA